MSTPSPGDQPPDTPEILDRAIGMIVSQDRGPASAVDRWAHLVLKGCGAPRDLRTLGAWAECVGVSVSSLREACYVVDVQPRVARDFMRLLRAALHSDEQRADPAEFLTIYDSRTLRRLFERAGLDANDVLPPWEDFLTSQDMVPDDLPALAAVRGLLSRAAT